MKTVKKILSLMLVAAMLLSVLPGQWIAAAEAPQLVVGSATVDVSQGAATCVVPVEIKNNPGFDTFTLQADIPEGWSLVSTDDSGEFEDYFIQDEETAYSILCKTKVNKDGVTVATGVKGATAVNPANGIISVAHSAAYTGDGYLVFLTYSVPATAANGDHKISVAVSELASVTGGQYQDQTTVVAGKVTVTGGVDKLTPDNTAVGGVNPTYTYTGSAIEPAPEVTYGGKLLKAGTDYTLSYSDNTMPGTATITIAGTGAYQGTLTKNFIIVKADAKITGTAAYTKQYGDADFQLDAKANSGAKLSYKSSSDAVATVDANGKVTVVGTGSAVITVSAGETDCYLAPADFKVNVTVGAADQTLTGTTEYQKTYGDADFRLDVQGAQGDLSYESSNPAVATVSNGTVTVKGVGTTEVTVKSAAVSGKYNEASMTVKITVAKKQVTVSGITAADKTYDGTTAATVSKTGAVINGKVAGDDLDVTVSGAFEDANAGSNKTVQLTVKLSGAAAGNYELADGSQSTATATIEKAKVAVPTAKTGLVYNGAEQTGVEAGEGYTVVSGGTGINGGEYTAIVSLKDAANYQWSDAGFNGQIQWTIGKAPAPKLSREVTLRYNSTQEIDAGKDVVLLLLDRPCDVSIYDVKVDDPDGILTGGTASYRLVSGLTAKDAGKTATITLYCELGNYENTTLVINVKVIDKNDVSSGLSFANGTATYTGEKHTLETATYNGSSEGIRYSYSADPVNAGSYTVTAIYEDEDNYGEATATLTINPAEIQVVSGAAAAAKTYDGTTAATVTDVAFEGLVNGETLDASDYTVTAAEFADANAGTGKSVRYTVELVKNAKTNNYVLTAASSTTTGTIEPKTITVQVEAIADQTFTGKALKPSVSVRASGTVDGYTLVEGTDYTVSYKNNTNAGTAAAVVSAKSGSNYTFTDAEGTFVIRKLSQPQLTVPVLTVKYSEEATKTATISGIPTNAGQVSYTLGQMTGVTSMVTAASAADGKISVVLTAAQIGDEVIIPVTVEMENYETVTVELKIVRSDKDTPVAAAQNITKTYDGKELKDSDIIGVATFDGQTVKGKWYWVTDPATMINAGTYQATVLFSPDDETNYSRTNATLTVVIKQGKLVAPTIERNSDAKTLDDLISDKDFKDENGNQVPGKLTWYDEDGNLLPGTTEIDKNTTYTWKFVPDDQKNYGSGISGTYKASNANLLIWAAIIGGAAGGHHFDDVTSNDWYADAVNYVVREGLFEGVSDDKFDPNGKMTRAMLVTVLWRMEGSPKVYSYADFKDVSHNTWYTTAVAWASKHGIVKGISDTEFAPDASITREQMAALLYRYAEYKGVDISASASLTAFTDGAKVSKYAQLPMEWAVTFGLIQGMNDNTLAPQGTATRAQVATILMRFSQWFGL